MKPQTSPPTDRMDRYRSSSMCSLATVLAYAIRLVINAGILIIIWMVLRIVLHL